MPFLLQPRVKDPYLFAFVSGRKSRREDVFLADFGAWPFQCKRPDLASFPFFPVELQLGDPWDIMGIQAHQSAV